MKAYISILLTLIAVFLLGIFCLLFDFKIERQQLRALDQKQQAQAELARQKLDYLNRLRSDVANQSRDIEELNTYKNADLITEEREYQLITELQATNLWKKAEYERLAGVPMFKVIK